MAEASRDPADPLLRIGELADLTRTTPRMLRHYENHGLVSAERSTTGQRLFDTSAIAQIHAIRRLLAAGLSVEVIGELLHCIHDTDRLEPCAVPLLVQHLRDRDTRIAELTSTRDELQSLIDASLA